MLPCTALTFILYKTALPHIERSSELQTLCNKHFQNLTKMLLIHKVFAGLKRTTFSQLKVDLEMSTF